jgi:hypothetical protein
VASRRYEQKSIVITTNLPFKQWDTVFPNAACAVAVFDGNAFLVSDPLAPRLYVVEPQRVTFIDYRLQPTVPWADH